MGDVALVYPWLGCGKCATCVGGDENMCVVKPNSLGVYCDGGYADHMTVPNPKYLLNLKGLDPVTAAPYACSGVTTYSALKKVEFAFNSPIVIFGAGGLGLMALSLLKAMGGKGAIVVDIDARKREAAQAAGALATVDGKAPDALEQLAKTAGGPIRAVIDLVGNAQTTQLGFDCLTKGGKLVIVGLFGGGAPWALPLIPIKAITIQGSYVGNLRETEELLDLVRNQEDRADSGNDDAAREGQRSADRFAKGQTGRPRGADAVGDRLPASSRASSLRAQHKCALRRVRSWILMVSSDGNASLRLAMTAQLRSDMPRNPHVRKQRPPHRRARRRWHRP